MTMSVDEKRDEVLRCASDNQDMQRALDALVAAVRAEERERCATIAEGVGVDGDLAEGARERIAAYIRGG